MLAVRRNITCVGTTKQCRPRPTVRNVMLMEEKLEDQVMKHQHYANKEVSLPCNVCQSSENSVEASFAIVEMIANITTLSREKFHRLLTVAARIIAIFGSTFVCEHFFSSMKFYTSVLSHD